MKQKANVHIIATGGTIAGRADSAAATVGYKAGELTVGQLIASVPGLEKLAGLFKKTVASGVPVVIATRCGGGIVVLSEEMTVRNGFIASGLLNPQKAKILLQLALTKTNEMKEIRAMFQRR